MHGATQTSVCVKPASAGTGIVFVRIDVPENNKIVARFYNVVSTTMCTTLSNAEGVKVSTVEHLCAAFFAHQITDVMVEISGPEMPILDGSSDLFHQLMLDAGIAELNAPYKTIEILEPVRVTQGIATAAFLPSMTRSFRFMFDAHSPFYAYTKGAHMDFNLEEDSFEVLCKARTFGLYEDAQKLLSAGLARGASLENTVILKEGQVMNESGLRYTDELLRHKVLDALGDIALSGFHIIGAFEGINSGHGLNNQLLHTLAATPDAWRIRT